MVRGGVLGGVLGVLGGTVVLGAASAEGAQPVPARRPQLLDSLPKPPLGFRECANLKV